MSQIFHKLAKNHKPNESASSHQARSRTKGDSRLHLSHCITNVPTGTFIGLIVLPILALPLFFGVLVAPNTYASPYALSISFVNSSTNEDIASPVVEMSVAPSYAGTFSKSSTSTIGIGTTSNNGYTIGIASSDSTGDKLFLDGDSSNSNDNTKYLSSISSATTEEVFKALGSTSYNNKWGYLPSKWDGQDNTAFLPAPTTTGDILDSTTVANTVLSSTATDTCKRYACDKYDVTIGARVDSTMQIGAYSNTYVIYATANGTPYTITYKDNTISNMPADESSNAMSGNVTISNQTPIRDGYTFIGWCTVSPTVNANGTDTCTGTTYNTGGTGTSDMTWNITEGATTNNLTLYAMWSGNYTIGSITTMQEFSTMFADKKAKVIASMVTDQQYQLTDTRDNKTYWVAKLRDGNVWMTQGLDLNLKNGTNLTHDTSDIGWTENKVTKTWNPDTTANTGSFDASASGDPTVPNWTNDNDKPYSTRPYYGSSSEYMYMVSSGGSGTDTATNLAGCTTSLGDECSHYKVGTYYNFAAATATNSVAGTVGHTITDSDNYTVMPDSICPAGWRLPHGLLAAATHNVASINNSEFDTLVYAYGITPYTGAQQSQNVGFAGSGSTAVRTAPLYFVRSGRVSTGTLDYRGTDGRSWSSTISAANAGYDLAFNASNMLPAYSNNRLFGFPVRCLVR